MHILPVVSWFFKVSFSSFRHIQFQHFQNHSCDIGFPFFVVVFFAFASSKSLGIRTCCYQLVDSFWIQIAWGPPVATTTF